MSSGTSNPTLHNLQLLRFVAAFMVVITHATFYLATRTSSPIEVWNTGAQGVRIFFVISGFVMILTCRRLPAGFGGFRTFMSLRLIRIAPLYWTVNALKIVQFVVVPSLAFVTPDIANIIFSLLFVPSRNAAGQIESFYGVGWTLNFEMFFYVLCGLALAVRIKPIYLAAPILLAMSLIAPLRNENWAAVTFLLNPIVLNFLWGMLIAEMYLAGHQPSWVLSLTSVVVGGAIILLLPQAPLFELQFALLVGGFVFLEKYIGARVPKLLVHGGDISYSLYLIHPTVGVMIAMILHRLHLTDPLLGMIVIGSVCLVFAHLCFAFFERPVTDFLKKKYLRDAAISRPLQPSQGFVTRSIRNQ